MFIDRESYKSLHLPAILEMVRPYSEVGKRLKTTAKPYTPGNEIQLEEEYRKIQSLMSLLQEKRDSLPTLSASLSKVENIRQTFVRASEIERLELSEIYEIKSFIFYSERIRSYLCNNNLERIVKLNPLQDLFSYLDPEEQQAPVFHISSKYSNTLFSLRQKLTELNTSIINGENKNLRLAKEELGLQTIEKQIVVSRRNRALLQKLENSPWFTLAEENFANLTFTFRNSEEIIELSREQSILKQKIVKEELVVRKKITSRIAEQTEKLLSALTELAKLDYLLARAVFGHEINGIIPKITELLPHNLRDTQNPPGKKTGFIIKKAVNLPVRKLLDQSDLSYQPVDFQFRNKINVITGANMAGKSTILKTIGQFFYLAAHAIPLPCQAAEVPLIDFLFFSSDTDSSNRTDLSSFASELIALNRALEKSGRGLFLIDEFARGTNPREGESFARAILESFLPKNAIVISATHFTKPSYITEAAHFRVIGLSNEDYEELKRTLAPQDDATSDIPRSQLIIQKKNVPDSVSNTKERYPEDKEEDLKKRLQELHKHMNYQLEHVEASNVPPRAALMIAEILGIDEDLLCRVRRYLTEDNR